MEFWFTILEISVLVSSIAGCAWWARGVAAESDAMSARVSKLEEQWADHILEHDELVSKPRGRR